MLPERLNDKPHYVLHPLRLARRLLRRQVLKRGESAREVVRLPWGLNLEVDLSDQIGYTIRTGGIFDPVVTDVVWRLVDPGDRVIDVGANIGYLTSVAAVRAGTRGEVMAVEPHPAVYARLRENVERWQSRPGLAAVRLERLALSDRGGDGQLEVGPDFHLNLGLAALRAPSADAGGAPGSHMVSVSLRRLDELAGDRPLGLLKIDVEGHEAAVLRGAAEMLRRRRVRDVVFEDHEPYPSAATEAVETAGYVLYALECDLLGPRLVTPSRRRPPVPWPGPSYLATADPDRVAARLRPRRWAAPGILPLTSHPHDSPQMHAVAVRDPAGMLNRALPVEPAIELEEVRAGRLPARYGYPMQEVLLSRATALLRPASRVLDVGSGRLPTIPLALRPDGCEYVGLDISADELEAAPPGSYDRTFTHDITRPAAPELGRFDLIVSWQVLEHVANLETAVGHLRQLLAPRGTLVAHMSGSWALFSLAASLMPHALRVKAMARFLGHPEEAKFPTHYDRCWFSALRRILTAFDSAEVVPFYRGATYLAMSGPLQRAYLAYENRIERGRILNLATHYLIVATR